MASIARKNLFEDIPRLLIAQAGIMFAVSLVTIQTGILNGFTRSTGILIERSKADIWVSSKDMVQLELTLPMPASYVQQAQQVAGVQRSEALLLGGGIWRSPKGKITSTRLFGFDPAGQLFNPFEVIQGNLKDLEQPYTVITDETNLDNLDVNQVGDTANIGSLRVKLAGLTQDTQSIASGNYLFMSLANAKAYSTGNRTSNLDCRLQNGQFQCTNVYEQSPRANSNEIQPTPLTSTDAITYVLVQAKPGQDLQALKQRLEKALPDTRAYTREEMANRTRNYWVQRTGIG
ncbi:MAG TPA: ABC transporter permease, partial [Coleofasciculaceae cyanobacterium]